jgi:glycosyltransferase involved in cell wall biosynthesis
LNIHIYPSVFTHESRILKIVHSLRRNSVFSHVAVIALWKEGLPRHEVIDEGVEVIRVSPVFGASLQGKLGKVAKVLGWYLGVLLAFRGKTITCFNCHSLPVLPLAILVKWWKRSILVYEPHELETETVTMPGWARPMARSLEWAFIRFADAVCLVNQSIAEWYVNAYRLKTAWVVRNLPYRYEGVPVRTGLLRSAVGLNADAQIFLYQGGLVLGRGVEHLLDAFSQVSPEKHLVFMGYGVLESRIKDIALTQPNVHFVPAVPPEKVQDYTVDADIGLSLIENVCRSYYLCLPNKVFEYAACGVPAVVSAFPEMGRFVDESGCGWKIPPNADALRELINTMTPEVIATKRANTRVASGQYCWQEEEKALLAMYRALGLFVPRERNAMVELAERN